MRVFSKGCSKRKSPYFHCREKSVGVPRPRKKFLVEDVCLIEEVLAPLLVFVPDQAHELPGSVQGEGTRPARQRQAGFLRRAVALTVVALVAARHQILPGRAASP